ncbi:MAG: hypothetical protein ACOYXY_17855 [Thermodesulfobacteriota bacterium]
MDVKIPLTKLFLASLVLTILVERKGNHADQSAFFVRRKWTLQDTYQVVWGLIGLIFVYKVLVPLWFPWDTPEGHPGVPRPLRGRQEDQNGNTAA